MMRKVVLILVLILVLGLGLSVWWLGRSEQRLTIALIEGERVGVLKLEKGEGELFWLSPKMVLRDQWGGEWEMTKLAEVARMRQRQGEVDQVGEGVEKILEWTLAVSVDGFKDDFALWEKLRWWLRRKGASKITEIELGIDGFDERDDFWRAELVESGLTFGVFNASELVGKGIWAARVIENLGGRVVEVGNSQGEAKIRVENKEWKRSSAIDFVADSLGIRKIEIGASESLGEVLVMVK
jgi:hypothetical protein